MNDRIEARLTELKREYELGEEQLRALLQRQAALQETLLRIGGAIQVLEELREPAPGDDGADQVMTVG